MGKELQKLEMSRWFTTDLRVRYQESDQMGVVYHANYLNWFEIGRTEMIRELGITYRSMEEQGILLPVIELDMKFKQPARYDDHITIFTRITNFTKLRISYSYEIRRLTPDQYTHIQSSAGKWLGDELPGDLLVTGTTGHVWLNREWRPIRLDSVAPNLYNALAQSLANGGNIDV
ncbi:acyl-CoA thioesterase [Paenibacillus pini]|uniref:4-hydroxybenzoyl-CoA thioesterase family n=1 Tax=Paenibacillus pini JCM 16418 TaxID=1236976 RepID=W7YV55_9BACL|nr:thioesterase family protein [Paenibacillus pini]GAF06324.1 4-hydroxybenzoyl-CoA thioesterase family [Paenibacillus pini JCM 16418]